MCRSLALAPIAALALGCASPTVTSGISPVPGCGTDGDCPTGFACNLGACEVSRPCSSASDCRPGEVCDPTAKVCRAVPDAGSSAPDAGTPCTSSADCPGGAPCVSGFCQCTPDSWSNYASAEFRSNCFQCHSWATNYGSLSRISSDVRFRISNGLMPPSGPLPQATADRLTKWIDCGLPR